jgi:hypothetical protein
MYMYFRTLLYLRTLALLLEKRVKTLSMLRLQARSLIALSYMKRNSHLSARKQTITINRTSTYMYIIAL